MLDAPVSGGAAKSSSGDLTVMASVSQPSFTNFQPVFFSVGFAFFIVCYWFGFFSFVFFFFSFFGF
ncbi:NAD(P)-binding domain-containing protein [Pasteurella multocida]|uniref:NAD(P)-binding domain-containing protein n=1 Tax=Pasteurella multocida TaxID=747 RepID=UPI003F7254D0